MRADVRAGTPQQLDRTCPTCETTGRHTRYASYPATATTGAWGKYLNPVYCCAACQRAHVLAVYEADRDEPATLYPYPGNQAPDRHLTPREKLAQATEDQDAGA